jgi:hypothetical protein
MTTTRRPELLAFLAAFALAALVGCLDFTGAPCTTSSTCPNSQQCVAGTCRVGTVSGTGGGTAGGTGGGTAGGTGGGSGVDAGGNHTALECAPCSDTSDCVSGLNCGRRSCDGAKACFSSGGVCNTIGGVVCPKVVNFRDCTSASDCEADAKCLDGRCLQACAHDTDCFLPSTDLTRTVAASCVSDSAGDARCYPSCVGQLDAVCGPLESYCSTFGDGTFGYCELGCGGCDANAKCPDGSGCFGRRCDGLSGCFPNDGGICNTIELTSCPAVSNFGVCTDDTDCGALAKCVAYGAPAGTKRCLEDCSAGQTCFQVFVGAVYPSKCMPGTPKYCVASCTALNHACPTGTTCTLNADTTYYCQ